MKGQRTRCFDSYSLLLSCLMLLGFFGSSAGRTQDCSSSCGEIENIGYPFRLKSDPPDCGNPNYELICSGNRTILEDHSEKYYVTNISYGDVSTGFVKVRQRSIHVVNVELASGKCVVPSRMVRMVSSDTYYSTHYGHYYRTYHSSPGTIWLGFFNCSEKIPDVYGYKLVPCLNGNKNDEFIYVKLTTRSFYVSSLAPSCSFLSEVPTREVAISLDDDIFQQLKMGFWLMPSSNALTLTVAYTIHRCLSEAIWITRMLFSREEWPFTILSPIFFEAEFVACLSYQLRNNKNFARVLVLVLTSVLLLAANIAIFVAVFAIVGRFVLGPLSIFVFLCHQFWKMRTPMDKVEKYLRFRQNLGTARYSYRDIVSMTGHFKVKLGQGGFGSVYRGNLPGGYPVAVKMLGNSKCNGDDFISEVSTIGRIRHLNVVRLLGFCSEGTKRALVYEFMSNGSLDKYIFSSDGANRHFTKEKLNEIALGVARGIDYLHRGCDMRILHFDIKPQNILLDHNFNPKVSDFGLARLYSKDYSIVSVSVARGTIGYIAPELVSRCFGAVSTKSDVYSFGMLLMEMAGARRNYDRSVENSSQCYYPSWIYDRLQQLESGPEICDAIEIDDMERKLCKVGLACIQTRASDRPPMSRVIEMLEADVDTLPMPPKPFLSSSQPVTVGQSDVGSSLSELSIVSEE